MSLPERINADGSTSVYLGEGIWWRLSDPDRFRARMGRLSEQRERKKLGLRFGEPGK